LLPWRGGRVAQDLHVLRAPTQGVKPESPGFAAANTGTRNKITAPSTCVVKTTMIVPGTDAVGALLLRFTHFDEQPDPKTQRDGGAGPRASQRVRNIQPISSGSRGCGERPVVFIRRPCMRRARRRTSGKRGMGGAGRDLYSGGGLCGEIAGAGGKLGTRLTREGPFPASNPISPKLARRVRLR